MSAHFAKCSYPQKIFLRSRRKTLPPNMLMTADFAFSSYPPKNIFRLSPESWSIVSFGSPSLSSSSLLTRLRPQNYALQVSFHAVYRRKTWAEIPLPPKFIFKDSLAPTKDATFGQKFQWPPTFSKKMFAHCALPPTMTPEPSQNCTSY